MYCHPDQPDHQATPESPGPLLRVGGLVPFTATDYPGKLAAVIFCQGCPWHCAYCHNPHLIPSRPASPEYSIDWLYIDSWLDKRRGLLDGVVFSGGEPTTQGALPAAIKQVRDKKAFAIGLHTGGAYPQRLQEILPLLDWVGLDIKATQEGYEKVTGVVGSGAAAFASLDLLCRSGVDFEVRTTVHAALTPAETLLHMGQTLQQHGVRRWVLQPFRAQGCDNAELLTLEAAVLDAALLNELRQHVAEVVVR